MKIKTKSGFVCDVDERMAADWDFVDALVDCESDDATKRVIASSFSYLYTYCKSSNLGIYTFETVLV